MLEVITGFGYVHIRPNFGKGGVGIAPNKLSEQQLILYPNPTSGELHISNGACPIGNVEIFDVLGIRQKAESRRQNGEMVIDVSNLNSGIYFIVIESINGEKLVNKMVKK